MDELNASEDNAEPNIVPLSSFNKKTRVRVRKIRSSGVMRRRLQDLGILLGAEIDFVRAAPLNDPVELRVGNAFISLRKVEAERIDVEEVKSDHE